MLILKSVGGWALILVNIIIQIYSFELKWRMDLRERSYLEFDCEGVTHVLIVIIGMACVFYGAEMQGWSKEAGLGILFLSYILTWMSCLIWKLRHDKLTILAKTDSDGNPVGVINKLIQSSLIFILSLLILVIIATGYRYYVKGIEPGLRGF